MLSVGLSKFVPKTNGIDIDRFSGPTDAVPQRRLHYNVIRGHGRAANRFRFRDSVCRIVFCCCLTITKRARRAPTEITMRTVRHNAGTHKRSYQLYATYRPGTERTSFTTNRDPYVDRQTYYISRSRTDQIAWRRKRAQQTPSACWAYFENNKNAFFESFPSV